MNASKWIPASELTESGWYWIEIDTPGPNKFAPPYHTIQWLDRVDRGGFVHLHNLPLTHVGYPVHFQRVADPLP